MLSSFDDKNDPVKVYQKWCLGKRDMEYHFSSECCTTF